MPRPQMVDEFGAMVRRLVGMGVSEDAARAAARAAGAAPPAQVRQLGLPLPERAWPMLDEADEFAAALSRSPLMVEPAARELDGGIPAAPDMSLGSPLWHQMDKGSRAYDNLAKGRTANLRNQTPDFVRIAQRNINEANQAAQASRAAEAARGNQLATAAKVAAPVAAVAGGAAMLGGTSPQKPTPSTTADLAEESRPAPQVAATDKDGVPLDEQKFTEMFKRQYLAREEKRKAKGEGSYAPKPAPAQSAAPAASPSDQAKAILADLNERRRKAGREVPEAKQMMDQANRLLAQGNQQRNAPGFKPAPMSNPREQAQALLQKLNADRMEAGGEVPHSQQVLAEVRRLQAMADEQDWRR